jgi:NAD(P)-dependent dehydrogenase (short-subunit alcohol dehydrogenase family)
MTTEPTAIDRLLDQLIAPGFSRIGYETRRRLDHWRDLSSYDMAGKRVVLTGVTSGIGAAAAEVLHRIGADLLVVGRDATRTEASAARLRAQAGRGSVDVLIADVGDLTAIEAIGEVLAQTRLDVLIHNAGALSAERHLTAQGHEQTVATHVLGPFRLTTLLLDALRQSSGRVITVASGGMYSASLPELGDTIELSAADYDGTKQYARAKRAQVTLSEMWAAREPQIHFHAMHPGWADTPGVQTALPAFRRLTKPILRTSAQGADTVVWLAADDEPGASSGRFWSDRAVRPIHKTASTRRGDAPERRAALWEWCDAASRA